MVENTPPGGDQLPPQKYRGTDNLEPEYFRGLTTENADSRMISIENWRAYRQINEEETKAAIPLFFREVTALWYQALPDNNKDTLDHLKTTFKDIYQAQDRDKWKRAGELFNSSQTARQLVSDIGQESRTQRRPNRIRSYQLPDTDLTSNRLHRGG